MDLRRKERTEERVQRVPFGGFRLKMQLSDTEQKAFTDRGMVPHWFNDQDGRIERAQSAGYTFVRPEHARSLGHGAVGEGNTDLGAKVSKIVSKGQPVIRAYLMETKKEFYDDDFASKQAINDKVDEALALGGKGGTDVELAYRP